MQRKEAIVLLAACKPLADRLTNQGVSIKLTDADLVTLAGFNQVWLGDWLKDPVIHNLAGLSRSDIGHLNYVAAQNLAGKPSAEID